MGSRADTYNGGVETQKTATGLILAAAVLTAMSVMLPNAEVFKYPAALAGVAGILTYISGSNMKDESMD